jgi:Class III cytochrome C family
VKKRPVLWTVIVLNLVALVALVFVYPHLMVSPGPLVKGHAELATDCFACHAPWRGAASGRCTECHAVAEVGLKTTKGVTIAAATIKGSFHQQLTEQDCMACHSDHLGPKLTKRSRKPFSHDLLKVAVRDTCSSCHAAPKDTVHRALQAECSSCHGSKAWKPATLDHSKYFVLDRDHQTTCQTCHKNNDFSQYTCYGCHEHSQAKIRAEHVKEGIQDFANCVECHRDPRVEPDKRGGSRDGNRGRKERD